MHPKAWDIEELILAKALSKYLLAPPTMRYMLIIHNDAETHPKPGGPGWDQLMAGYVAFSEELSRLGRPFTGDPLASPDAATTVRVREGRRVLSDGPFAETKEWLSGYFVIECGDLDEAVDLAGKIPSAAFGSVEVRPIQELDS